MDEEKENQLAIELAVEQASRDMPSVEVQEALLYKNIERSGKEPSVQGMRSYVEVEVKNLNDETETVLYLVWRSDSGELKVVRVTVAII